MRPTGRICCFVVSYQSPFFWVFSAGFVKSINRFLVFSIRLFYFLRFRATHLVFLSLVLDELLHLKIIEIVDFLFIVLQSFSIPLYFL